MKKRYTMELSATAARILDETASMIEINKSEVVRRSVSLMHYLAENKIDILHITLNGKDIAIIL